MRTDLALQIVKPQVAHTFLSPLVFTLQKSSKIHGLEKKPFFLIQIFLIRMHRKRLAINGIFKFLETQEILWFWLFQGSPAVLRDLTGDRVGQDAISAWSQVHLLLMYTPTKWIWMSFCCQNVAIKSNLNLSLPSTRLLLPELHNSCNLLFYLLVVKLELKITPVANIFYSILSTYNFADSNYW